mmetsp:Transcript_14170/g.28405  ORF Transcript_14170/g.28405 Transcript_14170/m.28405 type:complete len:119 (+) Transcript_14170:2134-2490(+)
MPHTPFDFSGKRCAFLAFLSLSHVSFLKAASFRSPTRLNSKILLVQCIVRLLLHVCLEVLLFPSRNTFLPLGGSQGIVCELCKLNRSGDFELSEDRTAWKRNNEPVQCGFKIWVGVLM